jgi:hypothetical protein
LVKMANETNIEDRRLRETFQGVSLDKLVDFSNYASFDEVVQYCHKIMSSNNQAAKKELRSRLSSPLVGATGILYHHYSDVHLYNESGEYNSSLVPPSDIFVLDKNALSKVISGMRSGKTNGKDLESLSKKLSTKTGEIKHRVSDWSGMAFSEYNLDDQTSNDKNSSTYSHEQIEMIHSLMKLFEATPIESPITGKYSGINSRVNFGILNRKEMPFEKYVDYALRIANKVGQKYFNSRDKMKAFLSGKYKENQKIQANDQWVLALPYIQLENPVRVDDGLPYNYYDDQGTDKVSYPDRKVEYLPPQIRVGHILLCFSRNSAGVRAPELKANAYSLWRQDVWGINLLKGGEENGKQNKLDSNCQ